MTPNIEQKLDIYADLVVKVGLNLQPGQRLFVAKAPIAAAPFVRRVVKKAYQMGAPLVDVLFRDELLILSRFQWAPRDSFTEYPTWRSDGWLQAARRGDAILSIRGENPDLLKGQDPELIGLYEKTRWEHIRPALEITGRSETSWTVIAVPTPAWAAKVFPELPPTEQMDQLWRQILHICRIDEPDPVAAWEDHLHDLALRRAYLNEKRYRALHFRGPGTDLTIGLPAGHLWAGGQETTTGGTPFTANIPTEEIFTMPHRDETEGTVRASLPLSYGGTLIEDFSLTFQGGRAVQASARRGEKILRSLLDTDEGAARLGEVALVPKSSPIAQTKRLYYDGLIDENAASHLALGKAYAINLEGGARMTSAELKAGGANDSVIHVDFMIGSEKLDVDGISKEGRREPIMRAGEWTFVP